MGAFIPAPSEETSADMKRTVMMSLWACLYAAFCTASVFVRDHVVSSGMAEIWGWDYRTFADQIQHWEYVSYFGVRHPGLGVVLSPLVCMEHAWPGSYLVVMPAIALLTSVLIFRMSGLAGLAIWLCFPVTWLMAAVPESFPVAQLTLVGSLYLILGKAQTDKTGSSDPGMRSCIFMAIVNGMVTLTNGMKPVLAYLLTCRNWRSAIKLCAAIVAIAAGVVCLFFARSVFCGRGCFAGIERTLSWIPEKRNMMSELYGFFIKPVGLLQSFVVYPLFIYSLLGLVLRSPHVLLHPLLGFVLVDAVLHLAVGWGMAEPWIFAPHWIFAVPLVVGNGIKTKWNRRT